MSSGYFHLEILHFEMFAGVGKHVQGMAAEP